MFRRHWKTLVAVLGGNLLYFGVLYNYLPPVARARTSRIDLGLVIDFWICVMIYGLLAFRFNRKRRKPKADSPPQDSGQPPV